MPEKKLKKPLRPNDIRYKLHSEWLSKNRYGQPEAETTVAVDRPEGIRYYKGRGRGLDSADGESLALFDARNDALFKSRDTPSDSVSTRRAKAIAPRDFGIVRKLLKKEPDFFAITSRKAKRITRK